MMRPSVATLMLALGAVSCGDSFAPYNQVDSLRVLAMRSTPAWPAPGETTSLDALVVSPSGAPLGYAWSWCPLVGSASEGYPCLVDEADLRSQLEKFSTGSGALLPAFDLGTQSTAVLSHRVPPGIWQLVCQGLQRQKAAAADVDCLSAFPVSVLLSVKTDSAEVRAKKSIRLRYSEQSPDNKNPLLTGVSLDAPDGVVVLDGVGTVKVQADTDYELSLQLPDTSAEFFALPDGNTSRERLLLTWFIDAGQTKAERTSFIDGLVPLDQAARNTWTSPRAKDLLVNPATFWVVAHDSRGGVDWTSGQVTIEVQR